MYKLGLEEGVGGVGTVHHRQEYDVRQRRTRGAFNSDVPCLQKLCEEKVAQLHRVCLERLSRYWEAGGASGNGRWVILEGHKEGVIGQLRCSNNNKRDFYGTFPQSRGALHKIIEQL